MVDRCEERYVYDLKITKHFTKFPARKYTNNIQKVSDVNRIQFLTHQNA